jgi:hypothetical protein
MQRPGPKKGSARRNDNSGIYSTGSVRRLSSENANQVGRPGFGHLIAGPQDGKTSVRRVMQRDPARGTSLPVADKMIADPNIHVDLYGPVNPRIVRAPDPTRSVGSAKKVIRPPRPTGSGGIKKR